MHQSFAEFMQRTALPMHLASPMHERLDGRTSGGNWAVAGQFQWKGRVWKVHADSHYEPLLLAYYSWQHLLHADTFVEARMENAQRLDLAPKIAAIRPTQHRYLYIYEKV
jgi:hypothetical protein